MAGGSDPMREALEHGSCACWRAWISALGSGCSLLRAVALVVGAFIACDSPSPLEPVGAGERVLLDREITDEVAGDAVARYSFVADSAGVYAVFLTALEGSVHLLVTDSTHR